MVSNAHHWDNNITFGLGNSPKKTKGDPNKICLLSSPFKIDFNGFYLSKLVSFLISFFLSFFFFFIHYFWYFRSWKEWCSIEPSQNILFMRFCAQRPFEQVLTNASFRRVQVIWRHDSVHVAQWKIPKRVSKHLISAALLKLLSFFATSLIV